MLEPKYSVSIDRITVVGLMIYSELQEVIAFLDRSVSVEWRMISGRSFELVREDDDGNRENMAFLSETQTIHKWRIDFNPNRLSESEYVEIMRVLSVFEDAHFSRCDIAFDMINDPLAMEHRLYRWNVSEQHIETHMGRSKRVETIYWGKRSSDEQVRLYDKYVEQKAKRKDIPNEIEYWTRLEIQLRGKRSSEWIERASVMLQQFKKPNLSDIENIQDRAVLNGLENNVIAWNELSKHYQAKLRKMISLSEGYDDLLSIKLLNVLQENKEYLEQDLKRYLEEFGVEKR